VKNVLERGFIVFTVSESWRYGSHCDSLRKPYFTYVAYATYFTDFLRVFYIKPT